MITDVQRRVLLVVDNWVKLKKTPVPQKIIITSVLAEKPMPESTIKAAVRVLVTKGYIRKAITFTPGSSYVQLRSL